MSKLTFFVITAYNAHTSNGISHHDNEANNKIYEKNHLENVS